MQFKMEDKCSHVPTTFPPLKIWLTTFILIAVNEKCLKALEDVNVIIHTRCNGNDCVSESDGYNSTATAHGFNSTSATYGLNSVSRCFGAFCSARCNDGSGSFQGVGLCLAQGRGQGATAVCNQTSCIAITNGVFSISECSGSECKSICKQEYCKSEMTEIPSSNVDINTNFTFVDSQRGGDLLLHNGYRYTKQRSNSNGLIVWRCTRRKICNVSMVTKDTAVIRLEEHKCESNANEVKIKLDKCIKRARTESTPIPSLYTDVVEEFNDSGLDLVKKCQLTIM